MAERDVSRKMHRRWKPISWPPLSVDLSSMDFCHVGASEAARLRSRFLYSRRSPYEIAGCSDNGERHKYQVVLEISGGALP